ncbi:MAG: hypothetical protein RMK84_10465 [Oscillochloridaceae bacterium]|nr:hypothetical protein [Chloroflexaceae bacterium]MDW8390535.1 hypothetical protein [Oscillochloridaceae bacterium]
MSQPDDQEKSPQQPHSDLANELRELGHQIEQAIRSTLESDRARQLQSDISAGLREIGAQLQNAMRAIQENPQVKELVQRGEQAVSQAQQSKVAQDFQETLARGVAMLNEQLAGFVNRMRGSEPTPPPPDDSAATGETTRLDPDEK